MNRKEQLLFSIIIPTYNRAHLLSKSIESIIAQVYRNWELIIVDDGSTDNTKKVVNSFDDSRIKYYYKKNEERSIARNFGIDKASGVYISFLDDDDYYLPEFLNEFYILTNKESNPVVMFMCNEFVEDEKGKRTLSYIPKKLLSNPVRLLWEIQTSIRPFVIHKEIFRKKRFKIECKWGEDFHLAIRIALDYPLVFLSKGLSVNVQHYSQGTHTKFIKNYRKNADLSVMCINDLLKNYKEQLKVKIPKYKLYDLINQKVYGFGSAAMKQCDFSFWFEMLKSINNKGSIFKTMYYYISLLGRVPFFVIKCLFS